MNKWDDLYKGVSCTSREFTTLWCKLVEEGRAEEQDWIVELRKAGFKAAHPNDGWVDRENLTVRLVYPQFNDRATTGDCVMLGTASGGGRGVILTKPTENPWPGLLSDGWHFEYLKDR